MNYLLTLLLCINSVLVSYSQHTSSKIYVEYSVIKGDINSSEYLIADARNALYTTDFVEVTTEEPIESKGDNDYILNPDVVKVNAMKYYSQKDSPNLYFVSQSNNSGKITVAIDSLPTMKWELVPNKTKKINTFTCFEATTNFRGSKITAYYTPEIPASFGPFKFKGLPGLILEAYNDGNGLKYYWKAVKIISPFNQKIDLKFSSEMYDVPIVTYRSIIEKFDDKLRQVDQTMKTRVSRGGSIKLNKTERVSIEKKYEWEEEQN